MLSRIIGRLLTSFPLPPFVPDFFSNSRLVRNDNSFEILIKKKFSKVGWLDYRKIVRGKYRTRRVAKLGNTGANVF